jgi:glycosyltransferase involved in cell wall biosynthesis
MSSVEVAIPTWNRRDTLVQAIDSALAQDHPNATIVVYDNASTDGTAEMIVDRYGESVVLKRWEENRGRHANMTRALQESRADYLILLLDDELLYPGALRAMAATLDRHQDCVFTFGRFAVRNADGFVRHVDNLKAGPDFVPPERMDGKDFIRGAFRQGDWTWIAAVMFALRRAGPLAVLDRDAPCDDTALLMRTAISGGVAFTDLTVASKTDGNAGESLREGLTEEAADISGHSYAISGIIGYRRTLERFLLNEGSACFSRAEQRQLLRDVDLITATLAGITTGEVHARRGWRGSTRTAREAMVWITSWRSRVRLLRVATRVARGGR